MDSDNNIIIKIPNGDKSVPAVKHAPGADNIRQEF